MILYVDLEGRPAVLDAADLKAFKVTGNRPDAPARRSLAAAGVELTDDEGHAFIAADTVKHLAQQSGPLPAGWESDFDAMVVYATSKGWTDERGRLRAHTEWTD